MTTPTCKEDHDSWYLEGSYYPHHLKPQVSSTQLCFHHDTALARAAFDQISIHFEAKIFVENVREVSKASLSGLLSLQRKILSNLLYDQGYDISSIHDGTNSFQPCFGFNLHLVFSFTLLTTCYESRHILVMLVTQMNTTSEQNY